MEKGKKASRRLLALLLASSMTVNYTQSLTFANEADSPQNVPQQGETNSNESSQGETTEPTQQQPTTNDDSQQTTDQPQQDDANSEEEQPEQLPVMRAMIAANPAQTRNVTLKTPTKDDPNHTESANLQAGRIADNAKTLVDQNKYTFVRALVNGTTEITYLAYYQGESDPTGHFYYSTSDDSVTGTQLDSTDSIVLEYKENKEAHHITYKVVNSKNQEVDVNKAIDLSAPDTVDEGDTFDFIAKAKKGYTITSVKQADSTLNHKGDTYTSDPVTKDNSEIIIHVNQKDKATLRFDGSNSVLSYNGRSISSKNGGGSITYDATAQSLQFTLHGTNQYTSNDKTLNKLMISMGDHQKVSINLPYASQGAASVDTDLGDVKVSVSQTANSSDEFDVRSKTYTVTITSTTGDGLYDDIDVITNFKDDNSAELFVKQLEGISPVLAVYNGRSTTLDPSTAQDAFLTLENNTDYTMYFNVLDGYVDSLDAVTLTAYVDSHPTQFTVHQVQRGSAYYGKYKYYFTLHFSNERTSGNDFRVLLSASKASYHVDYDQPNMADNNSYKPSDSFRIPDTIPTSTDGKTFVGWQIKGSDEVYAPGQVISIDSVKEYADSTSTLHLVAKWSEDKTDKVYYTVHVLLGENGRDTLISFVEQGVRGKTVRVLDEHIRSNKKVAEALKTRGINLDDYYLSTKSKMKIDKLGEDPANDVINIIYAPYQKPENLGLKLDNKTVKYNGEDQTLNPASVDVDSDTTTIEYSTSKNGTYSKKMPTLKDVGKQEIWARASNEHYKGYAYASATLEIIPRQVTVTAPSKEKVFDGTPLNTWSDGATPQAPTYGDDGFADGEGFAQYRYTSDSTITNVGTVANKINTNGMVLKDNTKQQNYQFTYIEGKLTVKDLPEDQKYQLTITPKSQTVTYNGKEQSANQYTYTVTNSKGEEVHGFTIEGATFEAKGTDAGDYSFEQKGDVKIIYTQGQQRMDVTKQFKITVNSGTLHIDKAQATLTAPQETVKYDGKEHTPSKSFTSTGIFEGHTVTGTVAFSDEKITSLKEQGEQAATTVKDVKIVDKAETDVTNNYNVTIKPGTLTISEIPEENDIHVAVTFKKATTTYNGKEQSYKDKNDFTYTITTNDYDTKGWTVKVDDFNINGTDAGTYKTTISTKNIHLYDENGDEVKTKNYTVTQPSLEIQKQELTIKAGSDSKEYDGLPLTSSKYDITKGSLQNGETITQLTTKGSQLTTGTSDNVVDSDSIIIKSKDGSKTTTKNYKITTEKGTLTITNKDKESRVITIKSGSLETMYDGATHTNKNISVDGDISKILKSGDQLVVSDVKATGSQTKAGSSDNTMTGKAKIIHKGASGETDVTDQYTIKYAEGKLNVTKRPVEITAASESKPYDGKALTNPNTSITNGSLADGYKLENTKLAEGSITEVGTKENKITKTPVVVDKDGKTSSEKQGTYSDNYEFTLKDGKLEITKADKSDNAITFKDKTVTYDGTKKSLDEAKAKVDGTTLQYRLAKQSGSKWSNTLPTFTDAGTYVIEVQAVNKNYETNTATATLTIKKRPLAITGDKANTEYDGHEHKVTSWKYNEQDGDKGLVNGQTIVNSSVKASASKTNVKDTDNGTISDPKDVKIVAGQTDVSKNYDITTVAPSITITPKEVKVESASDSKKYDGKALTKHELKTKPEVVDGDSYKVDYTGTQTKIGTSKNAYTITFTKGDADVSDNYKVSKSQGELKVYGEIAYDANKGSGTMDSDKYNAGDTYSVKENSFTRNGYNFDSWNTKADGTGTKYAPKDTITSLDDNVTLYAQWVPAANSYKIEKYYENDKGGYVLGSSTTVKDVKTDQEITLTDEQKKSEKANYVLDPNANNVFTGKVKADGSLVLKVYFAKDTIGPNPGGGGDNIPDKYQILFKYEAKENGKVEGTTYELHTFETDGKYTEPTPTKPDGKVTASPNAGYEIDQWTNGNAKFGNSAIPVIGTSYTSNQTFTVSFKEKADVTINYEAQTGGTVTNTSESVAPATGNPKGSTATAKPGYTFDGWYVGDKKVSDSKKYVPSKNNGVYESATYTAHFKENEAVTIQYEATKGGEVSLDKETVAPATGNPQGSTATAKPGYHFVEWRKGDAKVGEKAEYKPGKNDKGIYESATYTAVFAENDAVTINYKATTGGSVSNDKDVVKPATGEPKGSKATAKAGYHFTGWVKDGVTVSTEAEFKPEKTNGAYEAATYTAQFVANEDTKYQVVRHYEQGDGSYSDETPIERGAKTDTKVSVTDADKKAPEGYVLEKDKGNFEGIVAGDGSLVLNVYFAKDTTGPKPGGGGDNIPDKYQILFEYKAEQNGKVTGTTYELHTFETDGKYTEPTPTTPDAKVTADPNPGYHVDSWTNGNDNLGNGKAPNVEGKTYTSNQTFTVHFAENENVTINYEAEKGGSVTNTSESVAPATGNPKGSEAKEDAGYTFKGWYVGDKKVSDDKKFVPQKNNGVYESATYTAKFEPNTDTKYKVEFYKDGQLYKSDDRKGTTDTKVSVSDADKQAPKGYALDPNADNVFDGTVAGDGSLVLKVYFAKDTIGENPGGGGDNIPDKYQILFEYKAEQNGKVTGTTYELHTFETKDGKYVVPEGGITPEAKVEAKADAGYDIDSWTNGDENLGNGKAPNVEGKSYTSNQTFTVSFKEKESITIHYEAENGGSVSNSEDVINPEIGQPKGSTATAKSGYTFIGWFLDGKKVGSDAKFVPERVNGAYQAATYVAKFEKVPTNNGGNSNKTSTSNDSKKSSGTNTGVQTQTGFYGSMMAIAASAVGLLIGKNRKKKDEE